MQDLSLNFPFRRYPRLNSGYENNIVFNTEVKRFVKFINNFSFDTPKIIILIVGSLIDDHSNFKNESKQHLPDFLRKFIAGEKEIHIIVVNPKEVETPFFVKTTNDQYNWIKLQRNITSYQSKENKLFYHYFSCGFPEFVKTDYVSNYRLAGSNNYIHKNFKSMNFEIDRRSRIATLKDDLPQEFKMSIQNTSPIDNDVTFVNNFYQVVLPNFIDRLKVNSNMIILNYAVFYYNTQVFPYNLPNYFIKTLTEYSRLNNIHLLNYNFQHKKSDQYYQYLFYFDDNDEIIRIPYNNSYENISSYGNYDVSFKDISFNFNKMKDKKRRRYPVKYSLDDKDENKDNLKKRSDDVIRIGDDLFKIIQVPGDGDCMFNSILKNPVIMNISRIQDITLNSLRFYVANKIRDLDKDDPVYITLVNQIKQEGFFDNLINEITNLEEINKELIKHYTYFLETGPFNKEAEKKRQDLKLSVEVFYAGETELNLIAEYLNLTINVARSDADGEYFVQSIGNGHIEIFIIHQGLHFNILSKLEEKKSQV